jgi:hypothetical protein
MAVRVPAILEEVLNRSIASGNPELSAGQLSAGQLSAVQLSPGQRARISALRTAIASGDTLPSLPPDAPHASEWRATAASRAGQSWSSCDWFFAENYAYRCLAEACDFWQLRQDPFLPIKREEYRGGAHREALEAAAAIDGPPPRRLEQLLLGSVFGNRIDLSFAASRERGVLAQADDLLIDDRRAARELLERRSGAVHLVIDNAGTELSVDLVLAAGLLELLAAPVVLHVKQHPAFVSDAIPADLSWFITGQDAAAQELWSQASAAATACRQRLHAALGSGQLEVAEHAFWNGPRSLWECPPELEARFADARLVILKGDGHYRRAVGDALWPPEVPFRQVTSYFPAPLLALRTLKSDPIVGLRPGLARELDALDARWRVNGRRAVACLGGAASEC